jgi:uncharacterized protein YbjT (DUF2867 family)
MTRHPEAAADLSTTGVEVVAGDLRDDESTRAAVRGCRKVVAAAHGFVGPRDLSPTTVDRDGNRRLIDAAADLGADVVLMSVVGAAPDHELELFRMKAMAESHLHASPAGGTIVRATAFAELWIRLMRETAGRGGRPLVFGRGRTLMNFVSVRDVAALVDRVLDADSGGGSTLEIGGPDHLTMTMLAEMVQASDGRGGPPRHVPLVALRLAASTVGLLSPQFERQARTALWNDRVDHLFVEAGARARFPDLPRTHVAELLG